MLFQPNNITIPGSTQPVALGPLLQLPAEHASINITLAGHLHQFDYNSPASICGIPNSARNVAVVWGVFAALLVATVVAIKMWLMRKRKRSSGPAFAHILQHPRMVCLRGYADSLWFLISDVVWFVYSQASDAVAIHHVFRSGQLQYAYALLGILLLQFAFTFIVVAITSVRVWQARMAHSSLLHSSASVALGLVCAPFMYILCAVALVLHGLGAPLPTWFESLGVDLFSLYRLQSLAETFLNALPQSIVQTKLYMMGNDPNGVHVYIDTGLYLFSVTSSLLSVLKSVAFVMFEHHTYSCRFVDYCATLLRLESLEVYKELRGTNLTRADLVSKSSASADVLVSHGSAGI